MGRKEVGSAAKGNTSTRIRWNGWVNPTKYLNIACSSPPFYRLPNEEAAALNYSIYIIYTSVDVCTMWARLLRVRKLVQSTEARTNDEVTLEVGVAGGQALGWKARQRWAAKPLCHAAPRPIIARYSPQTQLEKATKPSKVWELSASS